MAIPNLSLDINQHDDKRFVFDILDDEGEPLPIADLDDIVFVISDSISDPWILEFSMSGGTVKETGTSQVTVDVNDLQSGTILGPGSFYCEMRVHIAGAPTIYQTVGAGTFAVIDTLIGDYA